MCFPAIGVALGATAGTAAATNLGIAATSAALGAVSSGMQFMGQRQQAKQQAEFQRQSIAAAQKKAQMQGTAAILERQQQEKAVAQEKGRAAKAGEAIVSRAGVAALESGVSGLSVQALMDDYIRQQAGQVAALTSQDKLYALRHGLNLKQLGMASEQEILGLSKPISKPSLLSGALSIASGAMSGYSAGKSFQNTIRPPAIDTGMGISSYMPGTDQYTLPARGPLAIRGR
jgi:hypothetical protein